MSTRSYVCGLLFTMNRRQVVLIEKLWPKWMEGKLNGVGGEVERDEEAPAAMIREFKEEAGLTFSTWHLFCVLQHAGAVIYWFSGFSDLPVLTAEREPVMRYWLDTLLTEQHAGPPLMANLRWLIPLALSDNHEFATVYDPTEVPK